jgi:hypothetical protein
VKLAEIVPFGPKAVTVPAPNNEATNVVPVAELKAMAGFAPGGSGCVALIDEMTRVDAGEHAEEPVTSDSVPRAQAWQASCPPSEKVLRGQARQMPREGEGAVPGAQRTQASGAYEAFSAAKPTAHGVEFVLPRGQ